MPAPSTRISALTTVAAIDPGAEIVEALVRLAEGREAFVLAAGHVEGVELRLASEAGGDAVRVLDGRYTLLQLVGPSTGPFMVTLSRLSGEAIVVLGGELTRARSAGVTAAVHRAGEVADASAPDAPRPAPVAVSRANTPNAPVAPPVPWARAAAASAARAQADEPEQPMPDAGDLVEHFAFGLAEVLTSDGERLKIRDLKDPFRVREVSMNILKVMPPTDSDGRRLFRLARKQPG
ncbi:MAG TPA: hypothetical protein VJT73_07395 [Polyangiaceae bacterium]|nr:hypothetical protein [Polyangiaceae bacterium]